MMMTRVMRAEHRSLTLALCVALMATLMVSVFGVTLSTAAPARAAEGAYTIEIHKFEQPEVLGAAANGLPLDTAGHTPVVGATFTAKRVPGIDLMTNRGQRDAGLLSPVEAITRVAGEPVAGQAITDTHGNATLAGLAPGLYLVQETGVPVGYVGSAAFLVALPLTDPSAPGRQLDTVHVYPKNVSTSIMLGVIDQDAVKLGDTVHWASTSTIAGKGVHDGYLVEHVINPNLELIGQLDLASAVAVSLVCGDGDCAAPTPGLALVPGVDYVVTYDHATRRLSVVFLAAGLAKLAQAAEAHTDAQVRIAYDTEVLDEGVHTNEAVLYPSAQAIADRAGVHDTSVTKWGPLSVVVHEHGDAAHLIAGACFSIYGSLEDAVQGINPISIGGVSEWITDSHGRLIVPGLRFSNFANGLDRDTSDELYRLYWAVPTCVPEGWQWADDRPLAGAVIDEIEFQTLIFEIVKVDEPGGSPTGPDQPNQPELPVTGGQIAGIGVLAVALIATGFIALGARRRVTRETSAGSSV